MFPYTVQSDAYNHTGSGPMMPSSKFRTSSYNEHYEVAPASLDNYSKFLPITNYESGYAGPYHIQNFAPQYCHGPGYMGPPGTVMNIHSQYVHPQNQPPPSYESCQQQDGIEQPSRQSFTSSSNPTSNCSSSYQQSHSPERSQSEVPSQASSIKSDVSSTIRTTEPDIFDNETSITVKTGPGRKPLPISNQERDNRRKESNKQSQRNSRKRKQNYIEELETINGELKTAELSSRWALQQKEFAIQECQRAMRAKDEIIQRLEEQLRHFYRREKEREAEQNLEYTKLMMELQGLEQQEAQFDNESDVPEIANSNHVNHI